jgi:hypothetical protein
MHSGPEAKESHDRCHFVAGRALVVDDHHDGSGHGIDVCLSVEQQDDLETRQRIELQMSNQDDVVETDITQQGGAQ